MKEMEKLKKRKITIIMSFIIVWTFLLRITDIQKIPIANEQHAFRWSETAIVIQNYFYEGWSLFHYQIPVFGAPWTTCIFECPIYQTVIYVLMRLFHQTDIDLWGRFYSIIIFYLSAWALKKVMDLFIEKEISLWICATYILLPYNIYWSRAILIDYMSVLFALLYIWGVCGWLKEQKKGRYIIGFFFGILGYLLKASTMFSVVYFLAIWILYIIYNEIKKETNQFSISTIKHYIFHNWKKVLFLGVLCIIPGIVGVIWNKYTLLRSTASVYTAWLSNIPWWNYGTWKQKLSYDNWKVILERIFDFFGGFYIFALFVVTYFISCRKKNLLLIISSIATCLLTIFTLFNLFYVHTYYLISLSPFICISFGVMAAEICKALKAEKTLGNILIGAFLVLLVYTQVESNKDYINWTFSQENTTNGNVGVYIKQITDRGEKILVEGEDWDPTTLYYAERRGFMLRNLSDSGVLREDNYTTLVIHHPENLASIVEVDDNLVQYPRYNNVYIYKLYSSEEYNKIQDKNLVYNLEFNQNTNNVYSVDEKQIQYIEINYGNADMGKEIFIRITDTLGNEYTDKIYLPGNKNYICYYINEICKEPTSISFGELENQ